MTKLLAKDGEGERLDRFELIAELASGGMATVFLARLSGVAGFQRLVAIKRLHPHLAREPEFVEMFLDEARLAARIHHPNVVPIQEVGESEHGYYLVMDYIEGDTLARVLAKAAKNNATVPYGVTIRVLLDVLSGLHAAHEMKDDHGDPLQIVHRDVSPQNILVGVDGVARVVDFGVARAASRLSTTRSGQLKGKLAYMAPEQARGAPVDRRADLFACGIVLWEALATKRLFKGDGEAETLNRVLYDPILPPSSARLDVPKPLEDVCMKALSRDPEQRFANAQDFGDALEKAARGLGSVGSVRDVAECLQDVIGVDLTQQRDAVRAWLARSEPSHGTGPRSKPAAAEAPSTKTRIEGRSESSSSGKRTSSVSGLSSTPRDAAIARAPAIDRMAVTSPAPVELLAGGEGAPPDSLPPEKVSSVSSAVIMVPSSRPPAGGPAPVPARSAGRIALVLVAAVVLVAVGALGARSLGSRSPNAAATKNASAAAGVDSASTAATSSPSVNPAATEPGPAASSSSAAPEPIATPSALPAAASAPPVVDRPRPGTGARPGGGTRPTTARPSGSARPSGAGASSGADGDLSKNPYR